MTRKKRRSDVHEKLAPAAGGAGDASRIGAGKRFLPAVIIIAAGLAAYYNSFRGVFVYDDLVSIRDNWHVRKLWPLSEAMSVPLWNTGVTVDGRPILSLSFALNRALLGGEPWGYHVGNLVVHVAAALLLFGIVRRTLSLPRFARLGAEATRLALVVAVIWVVHPLCTSSVTYIVQRAESLMGMFFLLTLYCAVRGFEGGRARPWFAASILACALGMGTKEVMAAAPVVVLLYDWVFVSQSFKDAMRRRRPLYLALAATWLILAALLLSTTENVAMSLRKVGALEYLATQPGAILYYLRLSLWPWPLVIDYNWPLARSAAAIVGPGVAVAAMLALTAWGLFRRRWWGFLGAWFFLILAPSSSFYPLLQNLFEHRMYLPLAALVVIGVLAVRYVLVRWPAGKAAPARAAAGAALAVAVAAAFAYLTHERNKDYHSSLALWRQTVDERPESFLGHFNLGNALRRDGQIDKAAESYRAALAIAPGRGDIRSNLGLTLTMKGQRELARSGRTVQALAYFDEAIAEFKKALADTPDFAGAHVGWGNTLLALGRIDEAIGHYARAVDVDPRDGWARTSLAFALLYHRPERIDEAIAHFSKAVELEPHQANVRAGLGRAFLAKGRVEQALAHIEKAVELTPSSAEHRLLFASALLRHGRLKDAAEQFRRAVELEPRNLAALNNLAWLLATRESLADTDPAEAVELAGRAAELTGYGNPGYLDTLAAAYAAAGNFDRAVVTAAAAIKLAEGQGNQRLARDIEGRLELYKAKQPYREHD